MNFKHLIMTLLTASVLFACNETKQENNIKNVSSDYETSKEDIVVVNHIDKEGNKLHIVFNNEKELAIITFNNETAELKIQKAASGIWYKNNQYELRGKGDELSLSKDGKVIFES